MEFRFCQDSASLFQVVGWLLLIFKIVIPILLIILGMIDLGKAVVSSDDKAVQKAGNSLLHRVLMAIAIFFVPTIVGLIFRMVGGFTEVKTQYDLCAACITSPGGDTCNPCATNSDSTACTAVVQKLQEKNNK